MHVSIYNVSDTDNTHSNKVRKAILHYFIPFYSIILTVSSFAFCFAKKRLAHNQSRSVPKTSLNASLHGLSELAITCVHGYMAVTVKVTKIYGKMNFNRLTLAIRAVPTTLTSRFPTTGYARVM